MTPPTARSTIWDTLLVLVVLGTATFGTVLMVLPDQTRSLFDLVAFPTGDSPVDGPVGLYVTFLYGIQGAVMLGWAVALIAIVRGPLRQRQAWAWWTVAGSIGGWYIVDTALSLWSGYPGNAILNTVFATVFAVPLLMIRRDGALRA